MQALGNVWILGDSYSTFAGWIPEGNPTYYSESYGGDVTAVEQTWWYPLVQSPGARLVRNSSYSGSTICHRGYEGDDYREISFAGRLSRLVDSGFFRQNTIDTCFLFGGTNDTWAESPLGSLTWGENSPEDLYFVGPAIGCVTRTLRTLLPEARCICLINDELKPEIVRMLEQASARWHMDCIHLNRVEKVNGHPTAAGMAEITRQIRQALNTLD